MDAVGADDQVVAVGGGVAELDGHPVVVLAEPLHRETHTDVHRVAVGCQDLVQVGTVQREAGADVAPQVGEVDVGQQASPMVAEALAGDQRSPLGYRRLQTEGTQRPCRVARQIDTRPGVRPSRLTLHHLGGEAPQAEGPGSAQPRDPCADHQNPQGGTVPSGRFTARMRKVGVRSRRWYRENTPIHAPADREISRDGTHAATS